MNTTSHHTQQQTAPSDERRMPDAVYQWSGKQRPDALDLVIETLAALQDGAALPDHCRAWLRSGLHTFLASGGMKLDEALEVKPGKGQSPLPKRYFSIARNYHIRRAAEYCTATSPWGRSMELADAVKRFASGAWVRTKHNPIPPAFLTPFQWELFMAFRASSGNLPTTARQLDNIVKAETKPPIFISETQEHDEPVSQKRGSTTDEI